MTDHPSNRPSPDPGSTTDETSWDAAIYAAFEDQSGEPADDAIPIPATTPTSDPFAPSTATGHGHEGAVASKQAAEETVLNMRGPRGYRLLEEIARGGVGVIYRGRDEELEREVAVKVLGDRHRNHAELMRRFVNEARIAARLQHPGVVPVYELGQDRQGRPFFSMKLVRGQTLLQRLADRDDPSANHHALLQVFLQVCQTMAYAHAQGVIHRDLKPANIMVGSFGEVQVMDWGFAKFVDRAEEIVDDATPMDDRPTHDSEVLSHAGAIYGTPAYMPPEQAQGGAAWLDARADVFALGAILLEILTGKPPYHGATGPGLLGKAADADLDDARTRLDALQIDARLITLTRRCLAPERTDRPAHAGEVAESMAGHFAAVEERTRAAELASAEARVRAAQERKARRLTLALAASVLALFVVAVGAFSWIQARERRQIEKTEGEVTRALGRANRLRAAGDHGAALVAVRHARALIDSGDTGTDLRQQVVETLTDFEQAERDRALTARLAEIRARNTDDPGVANDEYAAAFQGHGLDLRALSDAALKKRLQGVNDPLRHALAAALDDWAITLGLAEDRRRKRPPPPPPWAGSDRAPGPEDIPREKSGWVSRSRLFRAAEVLDPDPWRNALRNAVENNDLEALRTLADSVKDRTLSATSLVLLGTGLQMAEDRDRAIAVLEDGYRRFPGDYWINHHLARIYSQKEKLDQARQHAMIAMSLRPRSSAARFFMARVNGQSGDHEAADRFVKEAIELDPDNYRARLFRAREFRRDDDVEQAFREIRRALETQPHLAEGHAFLGEMLEERGDHEEAGRAFLRAFHFGRGRPRFHQNVEDPFFFGGAYRKSIEALERAIAQDPDRAELRGQLGISLYYTGDFEAAIQACRAAIKLDGRYTSAYATLGRALLELGRFKEAGEAIQKAGSLDQQPPYMSEAAQLCQAGRDRKADVEAVHAGGTPPANTQDCVDLARLALRQDWFETAGRLFAAGLDEPSTASSRDQREPDTRPDRGTALYDAVVAAVAAGLAARTDETRTAWWARARAWLGRDLAVWSKRLDRWRWSARTAVLRLQRYRHDRRLDPVRGPEALAGLPDPERAAWTALWQKVDQVLEQAWKKAAEHRPGPGNRPPPRDGRKPG